MAKNIPYQVHPCVGGRPSTALFSATVIMRSFPNLVVYVMLYSIVTSDRVVFS